ncbi:MAG: diguanylate cyclase [Actinomycetes bacterium]
MSLRTRLWLVLGALFLVPLVVGALVFFLVVPDVASHRLEDSLDTAGRSVVAEVGDECRVLGLAVRTMALEAAAADPQTAVDNASGLGLSYAALLGPSGAEVASAGALPDGAGAPADLDRCTDQGQRSDLLAQLVTVRGVQGATTAVVARELDPALIDSLRERGGLNGEVLLLSGGEVVASSADASSTRRLADVAGGDAGVVEVDGWSARVEQPRPGSPFTVVVAAQRDEGGSGATLLFVLISVAGAAAAGLLVTVVARGLSQPFTDLTEAAERVARGDLDTRITGTADGEAGRLSDAFNRMTVELRRNMSALEQSRGDLRDSLERIGDTLTSTHDLEGLLDVVLETAVATLQAKAGVVLWGAPDQIELVAEHGLHAAGLSAPSGVVTGEGVLGRVIASGEPVRGRISSGPAELTPTPTEPHDGDILAVPLRSMGAVLGVIALYDREDGRSFDAADDDALRTLAGQASIAVDNVQLHQEAERLSTTDALTGLWNFRYLSMSLAREIERSSRFERPLAVLMLDLDHFKQVNDVHGHAAGDMVLRELAQRVQEQIREVDTFARYGGEEFVVVLPETTIEGAGQLAERICTAVRRQPFRADADGTLAVTVSVGGSAFPAHGSSAATLMRAADRALYVAKHEGRDGWHVPDA